MPTDEGKVIKLMRCPIDTNCGDCKMEIAFGQWVYFNPVSDTPLCVECGIKRGWTPKDRINQLIAAIELREDIKVLREEKKFLLSDLVRMKQQIDLHHLGEKDSVLEGQIVKLMTVVDDYIKHVATEPEKEALKKVFNVIRDTQEVQLEVREQVARGLILPRKQRRREAVLPPEEQ